MQEVQSLLVSYSDVKDAFNDNVEYTLKDGSCLAVTGPTSLINALLAQGRKRLTIERYKGLGQMDPEQLWETTLDPLSRTLLQVKVRHIEETDDIFSTLMGDVVELRREFIQQNADKVVNLDA
jgi:DNA gyrase subunit B